MLEFLDHALDIFMAIVQKTLIEMKELKAQKKIYFARN